MTKANLKKLLKSGNFTICYWDNGEASVYKGKFNVEKELERDDCETMNKSLVYETGSNYDDGYLPLIVEVLADALGGKTYSI